MPTPYQAALAAIMAAETPEAAQAAYDEVKENVTAAQGEMLQMAVDDRTAALNMMARADDQKMALADAAGMIDTSDLSTQAAVDAARTAIATLRGALDDAADVSDADKAMYMSQLDAAVMAVDTAQGGINTETRRTNQMAELTTASGTLQGALAALAGSTPTQAQLDAANNALAALNAAITGGADLTDTEKAPYQREADNAAAPIETAQTAFDEAETENTNNANAAAAVTAAKLYAAIAPVFGDASTTTANARSAAFNPISANDPTPFISVNPGGALETADQANSATLNLDKDTPVADHRGWKGNRYVEKDADGNIITQAVVYSDEVPTMGKKFGSAAAVTATGAFQYQLTDGMYTVDGTADTNARLVGGSGFDQSAGIKEFALPSPNPSGATMVTVPGTFHGVSGTYSCTPTADNTCAANKAARGFTLGLTADTDNAFTASADVWTFKPTNPDARVTESADTLYAVYGWWLRKPAGNGAWTASAFADYYGAPVAINGLDALNGTATYTGGAAGKYALSSSTGGTNEAGHFTARATLEADFDTDMITGTVDNFMGVGGAKNWSVELMKSAIGATGLIRQSDDDNSDLAAGDPGAKTKWTMGDDAAAASGHWKGNFREVGGNGVPAVVTGDFYSEFGNSGKMVGAFGAKTE